ncbi:MAG: helix-turn-helix transcriptional regulator [Nocardioides sp.]|nr:helix-turn-helix transcriptional regulator [Nocardioides sp.]
MTDTIDNFVSTDAAEVAEPSSTVEVRRRVPLAAILGVAGSGVAIAYLVRATSSGSVLDWALCAVMALVGGVQLFALLDARSPLLVADELGLRVRRGRTWHGLPWSDVERVEHLAPRSLLRDGRLDVFGTDGTEWSVRLGLATSVLGGGDDLASALLERSGFTADVVEIEIVPPELHQDDVDSDDVTVEAQHGEVVDTEPVGTGPVDAPVDEVELEPAAAEPKRSAFASPTPRPLRALLNAVRSETRREPEAAPTVGATALRLDEHDAVRSLPEADELRRNSDGLEDTAYWAGGLAITDEEPDEDAGADLGDVTVVIDDLAAVPVADPVVGPELAAARSRLALSVDQLAERTRIRPHVIEAIEVDDFAPCGGDFYARGHLRTLARVLGVDVAPLLTSYDKRYADAPVDPRRVFEAELATGANGSIRGTRGGPNWSVLVAAVMAVVLVWSIAQLFMDRQAPANDALRLNGSSGPRNPGAVNAGPKVPFVLSAVGGGATVVVRDGGGNVVYDGSIAFMQTVELDVVPPVRVQSTDGSVTVTMDGVDQGAIGVTGQEAQDTYVVRD